MENFMEIEDNKIEEQIPKIAFLNAQGEIHKIILCDKNPEFSKKPNNTGIEYVHSNIQIHIDDPIHIVKHKIAEIIENQVSYSEIYLYGIRETTIDLKSAFDSVLERTTDATIPAYKFGQLLISFGIENEILADIPHKGEYSYEDLLLTNLHMRKIPITFPIGKRFAKPDYLFSATPYHVVAGSHEQYVARNNNPLISFENHILLNYGELYDNTIYVCLAEDVFQYASTNGMDERMFSEFYFPMLFKKDVYDIPSLIKKKQSLLKDSKAMNTKIQSIENSAIDLLYDIYSQRKSNTEYIENGITTFTCMIHPAKEITLPLESIFKNIHASNKFPFIKFNPGVRREKIYRLYSENITKTGAKIPFLDKNVIMLLSKTVGKSKEISVYIPIRSGSQILVGIHNNGNIHIKYKSDIPLSLDILENLIRENINHLIGQINDFLFQSSFQLELFHKIGTDSVEVLDMKYNLGLMITKQVNLNEWSTILQFLFDQIPEGAIENGIHMRYTRVENYVRMNDESSHIAGLFKQTNNEREIIASLIASYHMTEEEAILRIAQFFNEFTRIQGKYVNKNIDIVENPGFPVEFQIDALENILHISIDNIVDIRYIEPIFTYIDSFIRITQNPESTGIKWNRIHKLKEKKISEKEKEKEGKKEVLENVIVIDRTDKRAQPLFFERTAYSLEDEEGLDYKESNIIDEAEDEEDEDFFFQYANEGEEEGDNSKEEKGGNKGGVTPSDNENEIGEDEDAIGPYEIEQYKKKIDGMPLKDKNTNLFLKKLMTREPTLFLSNPKGNYESYSRMCPANIHRQPIILTDAEKDRIDREHPGSYTQSLSYGTSDRKYHYICPRYWCLLTQSSMTEAEVQESIRMEKLNPGSGSCGLIIPPNQKKVPKGHYIYEFDEKGKQHRDLEGKYVANAPGFLDKEAHPDGSCIPCCFKNWDSRPQKLRRQECNQENAPPQIIEPQIVKNVNYIVGIDKQVVPQNRWGFLPVAAQYFLQTSYINALDPNNPAFIKENANPIPLLRYGVEQNIQNSFLGVLTDLYRVQNKIRENISIRKFTTDILSPAITLDAFIKYHNGSLVTVFRPQTDFIDEENYMKYQDSRFIRSVDTTNDSQRDFVIYTVASFDNFQSYLTNLNSIIDHIFLWDIVSTPNPKLFPYGLNLAIMEIDEADVTENINLICPTTAYSNILYDPTKPTAIILKRNDFYEPIYEYHTNPLLRELFTEDTAPLNLKDVFKIIRTSTKKYCAPQSSMPKIYRYKRNHTASTVASILKEANYHIEKYVLNYQGKIIGFLLKPPESIFIPVFPSTMDKSVTIPTIFMDEIEIWKPYITTRDTLLDIYRKSNTRILCRPMVKVEEDGLIVGIITETDQFVQINPPEATVEDGIPLINGTNLIVADKVLTTTRTEDKIREETVRRIQLEEQFYVAFRTTIQILLKEYENRGVLKEIMSIISPAEHVNNPEKRKEIDRWMYNTKLSHIEYILRDLSKDHVEFVVSGKEIDFMAFENIMVCHPGDTTKKYCIVKNGTQQILLPKMHLYPNAKGIKTDNKKLYYRRLADELLRYKRIQFFIFEPNISVPNTNYHIDTSELLILNSQLTTEYFSELMPYKQRNITYDTGNPYQTQLYSNRVPREEQLKLASVAPDIIAKDVDCVRVIQDLTGNASNIWKKMFPTNTQEYIYHNSPSCTFYLVIDILHKMRSSEEIKNIDYLKSVLLDTYRPLFENETTKIKVLAIWSKQGKKSMIDKIRRNAATIEEIVLNEGYYLTNIDIWILADRLNLPIAFFSTMKLKDLEYEGWSVHWLFLSDLRKNLKMPHFFIKPPIRKMQDHIPEYSIVTTPLPLNQIKGIENMVKSGLNRGDYSKNVVRLDDYLKNYSTVAPTMVRPPIEEF